jgi:hypothetical protein
MYLNSFLIEPLVARHPDFWNILPVIVQSYSSSLIHCLPSATSSLPKEHAKIDTKKGICMIPFNELCV